MNPNGELMWSTHEAELPLRNLPAQAKNIHIIPDLKAGTLLSLGQLCDADCTVQLTKTTIKIKRDNTTIYEGPRDNSTGLWKVPIAEQANGAIGVPGIAERVAYSHAALFSPALSTLEHALKNNFIVNFPELTAQQLRKHPPQSIPMVKGHQDHQRKNIRSTRLRPNKNSTTEPEEIIQLDQRTHTAFVAIRDLEEGHIYTCLLYTSPSPRDATLSRMPSSA